MHRIISQNTISFISGTIYVKNSDIKKDRIPQIFILQSSIFNSYG
ncbi:hypothetical protein D1BOALGB6SA_5563 [Olavius sp. associated proteobacterium Delta 1]|nr:hypothetical protein D1BOALGB6SA_5563 [Olavius sp. associated proteobacterium Delta 1]